MIQAQRTLLLAAAALCTPLTFSSCRKPVAAPITASAPAPGVVLEIDGMQITKPELDAWTEYFEALNPSMGHKYRTRELLDQHLLKLHFARRYFAEERAEMLARATELSSVTDNYNQLKRLGEQLGKKAGIGGYEPDQPFARNDLPLPITRWAFRDDRIYMASKPIETRLGYTIIAGRELVHGMALPHDLLHAYVVNFNTTTHTAFETLWKEQRAAMQVTYVHPDLHGALPNWLEP